MIEVYTRQQWQTPGYDCERGPCPAKDCPGYGHPKRPGGGHGIHGEEWAFAVVSADRLVAISLLVFTDIYPPTVSPAQTGRFEISAYTGRIKTLKELRYGADLTIHVGFPTQPEDMADLPADWSPGYGEPYACRLVQSSMCDRGRSTALGARDFFNAQGDPAKFEQPSSFWLALTEYLSVREADIREARVDKKFHCCTSCSGKGFVPRRSPFAVPVVPE